SLPRSERSTANTYERLVGGAASAAARHDHQPRVGRERRALEIAVAAGLGEARAREHREQLGCGVYAQGERARVALACGPDQRLRHLRHARRRVERALLEQQPGLAEQLPVLL